MLELKNASYAYAACPNAVRDVSLAVAPGQRVVLLGVNGSGKSTVGRLANGSLACTNGCVDADGLVGMVGQDPGSSITSTLVKDDVAFGPRCLGFCGKELHERIFAALDLVGIASLANRDTSKLSGGQLQRVALASALACQPRYLVLDEVTSQLDGASRQRVRASIAAAQQAKTGILEITHRPEEVVDADAVAVMAQGRIWWRGTPDEFFARPDVLRAAGTDAPLARAFSIYRKAGVSLADVWQAPPNVASMAKAAVKKGIAAEVAKALCQAQQPSRVAHPSTPQASDLRLEDVDVRYASGLALREASLCVEPGTLCVVAGPSGSGKSTLARVASGVLAPDAGRATLAGVPVRAGDVGLSLQSPQDQLFCNTVIEDVMFGPRNLGQGQAEASRAAEQALCQLDVACGLWQRPPFALSGGEQRRVALAGVVAMRPKAYVFDEPTAGLDGAARASMRRLARSLADAGAAVVVVTHDLYEWLCVADAVTLAHGGRLLARLGRERLASAAWPEAAKALRPLELDLLEALHG